MYRIGPKLVALLLAYTLFFTVGSPRATRAAELPPLVIAREGYLFAGGAYTGAKQPMKGQVYAEFQIPEQQRHPYPIVMVEGGGQTGANFTGTPDGREGWAQFFLRRGYAVYVVDQVGRGRSGYDADAFGPPSASTIDFILQRFAAPERYDLWPQAHLHTQWPGNAKAGDPIFDQFVAQEVPGIPSFAQQQQLNSEGLVALLDRIGPAILLTHSQSGAFGWPVADARPRLVKGLVAVEPSGPPVHDVVNHGVPTWFSDDPTLKTWGLGMVPLSYSPALTDPAQLAFVRQDRPDAPGLVRCRLQAAPARTLPNLAQVPIVMIQSEASYHAAYDHCTDLYLNQAGVRHTFIRLVDRGIHGNGHMMMVEKNNEAIASVIGDWLDHTIH